MLTSEIAKNERDGQKKTQKCMNWRHIFAHKHALERAHICAAIFDCGNIEILKPNINRIQIIACSTNCSVNI